MVFIWQISLLLLLFYWPYRKSFIYIFIYFPKSRIFSKVSKIFLMKIIVFIQKGCIKLIKSDSKDIYTFIVFPQKYEAAQLFSTLIIIRYFSEHQISILEWFCICSMLLCLLYFKTNKCTICEQKRLLLQRAVFFYNNPTTLTLNVILLIISFDNLLLFHSQEWDFEWF